MAVLAHGAGNVADWHPHPDIWLLVAVITVGYWLIVRHVGPRCVRAGESPVTRLQVVCFGLGVAALWVAADWPVHDVAEGSTYSVHMVQHLLISMVATPLLLLGTPGWLARWMLRPPGPLFRATRSLSRFLPALIIFNLVLVLTHWPVLVNESIASHPLHFAVHVLIFVSSLVVWMPVLSPLPEIPRLAPPTRAVFLFLQSIVPTIPASFLTFGQTPLYRVYEGLPHIWGLSTLEDQQTAGLIMKLGAGSLLWLLIAVIFFKWAADEDRRNEPRQIRRELERELEQMRTAGAEQGMSR
ncbi:MAG: cytochrome c oxidase assembly protein [Actinobacteria bacterium]|nr:cytochrome c oxidase assembly protein [Actinomycetota bacterium]